MTPKTNARLGLTRTRTLLREKRTATYAKYGLQP